MLITALLSYLAGLLTALAPCVLPLLPIILGGSITGSDRDKKRPYIITASLVVSLIVFTILLKASTVLIGVDPMVWTIGSGVLVIALGIFMLFPNLWATIVGKLGIEHRTQGLLGTANKNKNRTLSAILTGAALGPIFSSCSPTYAWVIATVLPADVTAGIFYLAIYCLGVATSLLAIALLGRRLLTNIKWASNPRGWFQRSIAILFIIVGVFVITGFDKKVQAYFVDKDVFHLIQLEQKLVPGQSATSGAASSTSGKKQFNVVPYDAPELAGIADWINSDPRTIAGLKGKVVLIDFWTYSCINCQRTQPYLNSWYKKYKDDDFVILGVHAPEFAFEKVSANVEKAVKYAGIHYPVALDNDFKTWSAYSNQYWPAKYLIDKDGQVRYTHFGEGDYDKTESVIQSLLEETGKTITNRVEANKDTISQQRDQTPETYLGYQRAERFANGNEFVADKSVDYTLVNKPNQDTWSLGGKWQVNRDARRSRRDGSSLRFSFSAKEVYLVMSGPMNATVAVSVEGLTHAGGPDTNENNMVKIDRARLYKLVKADKFIKNGHLTLTFPAGVTVNAFTFGS